MIGRAVAGEVGATLRSAMWPLARLRPMPVPTSGRVRAPVVLVHGFMANTEFLRPLARRMLEEGFPVVERVGYPSLSVDFAGILERIAAVAVPLAERYGPVDLIGHSLGGFACRAWVKEAGGWRHVRRVVSLGAPHQGTSLYRFVPPWLQPALDPHGEWVRRVATGPEPVPLTVIRARYDHQVLPARRGSVDGVKEIVIEGYGHNGLLWAREAHDAVIAALRDEPTVEALQDRVRRPKPAENSG